MKLLVLICLYLFSALAEAQTKSEHYFYSLFAYDKYQSVHLEPHIFAHFFKIDHGQYTDGFTISWLPKTQKVHFFSRASEPGHNFSLLETLQLAKANHLKIWQWGATEIDSDFYEKALTQKNLLESDSYQYQAITWFSQDTMNCTEAVASIEPGLPFKIGITAGYAAGEKLFKHFSVHYLPGSLSLQQLIPELENFEIQSESSN